MVVTFISICMTICFMLVMYGNPFQEYLNSHINKQLGYKSRGLTILKYNDKYAYFYEIPYGISGTLYDGVLYIFDKTLMTKCAPPLYESVYKYKKPYLNSMCFLSEHVVRNMFHNTPHVKTIHLTDKPFLGKVKDVSLLLKG